MNLIAENVKKRFLLLIYKETLVISQSVLNLHWQWLVVEKRLKKKISSTRTVKRYLMPCSMYCHQSQPFVNLAPSTNLLFQYSYISLIPRKKEIKQRKQSMLLFFSTCPSSFQGYHLESGGNLRALMEYRVPVMGTTESVSPLHPNLRNKISILILNRIQDG